MSAVAILGEVLQTRHDLTKFDGVDAPDGTGTPSAVRAAERERCISDALKGRHALTWSQVLRECAADTEAAPPDSPRLRRDLIITAAFLVAWVEAIDRRKS